MREPPSCRWRQGLWSVALGAICLASGARGTDDMVVVGGPREEPEEAVRFAPVNVHVLGGRAVEYDLEVLFDQQLFGRGRGNRPVKVVVGRARVEASGEVAADDTLAKLAGMRSVGEDRIATLARVCRLSAEQQAILRMAIESDLRRVAGEIDAVRQKYAGQRMSATAQGLDQDRLQTLRDEAVACRRQIERIWQTGSLFASVSLGMLSPAQRTVLEAWMAERRAVRWEAMVRLVLGQLDETVLGLSAEQHDTLVTWLLADVPAVELFAGPSAETTSSRTSGFEMLLVTSRLRRLDEAALRRLVDPRQWAALDQLMNQQGPLGAVEALLVAQGIVEEEHAWPD